ncbi:2-C-methyl-D-erythritol 4-phosphate cytidylyltransferase [Catenovulum sp. SM1970]|uniref:2-C-methyl-D-erythritol 4-phosphate cytidylyltransferase n=1 Tax=Marinifaba aquimaris TaxID=2741323 RepID=UPI0015749C17|nr:2-C-methyl-D-erythritol 4-phosphate cytidylyltransferase [Marinifaba aquimaris]NTS78061.1 2-C-methyl-D-erythritol 4-phosphate cytidylyltransferase [Marinifaba aquimaris]
MSDPIYAIVPAAGVGKRMAANQPKQYLMLNGKTILEHTLERLLSVDEIEHLVLVVSKGDAYLDDLLGEFLNKHQERVSVCHGGAERVDSVLAGLKFAESHVDNQACWALVHDAARPCVPKQDIKKLIEQVNAEQAGGLLAVPVRDTMKRADSQQQTQVLTTVDRAHLWHALTPQMFELTALIHAIQSGLQSGVVITDEASAIEAAGHLVQLVSADPCNLKVTQPEDLALAEFFLTKQAIA